MNPPSPNLYKRHRFPAEIISHGVWLYFRFCLSYRDVEELMAARGVILTYEAVRYCCRTFGQGYANQLRCRRPRPGDKWHLDEVFLTINGARHYLWRAVDQNSHVLDILVQRRRHKKTAKKFFRKLLKRNVYRLAGMTLMCVPWPAADRSRDQCPRALGRRHAPPGVRSRMPTGPHRPVGRW